MHFTFDTEAQAAYLKVSDAAVARTQTPLEDDRMIINLDLDANGNAVGIEVVSLTKADK